MRCWTSPRSCSLPRTRQPAVRARPSAACAADAADLSPSTTGAPALRLLVLMAPGDMTSNTPVDCLLEDSDVAVTLLYVLPGQPLPSPLPEHDVVFVAIGESSDNQVLLRQLGDLAQATSKRDHQFARANCTHRPESGGASPRRRTGCARACNRAGRTSGVDERRARRSGAVSSAAGRAFPHHPAPRRFAGRQGSRPNRRCERPRRRTSPAFPTTRSSSPTSSTIVRRTDNSGSFASCWSTAGHSPGHMGISSHWMIHYVNAKMDESAEKRAEEERFFATFDRVRCEAHACASPRSASGLVSTTFRNRLRGDARRQAADLRGRQCRHRPRVRRPDDVSLQAAGDAQGRSTHFARCSPRGQVATRVQRFAAPAAAAL